MALHENFREYTAEELYEIKKNHCVKHKCPYLTTMHEASGQRTGKTSISGKMCNYILWAKKMRGCMPDECEHWKDTNVKQGRFTDDIGYNKEDY